MCRAAAAPLKGAGISCALAYAVRILICAQNPSNNAGRTNNVYIGSHTKGMSFLLFFYFSTGLDLFSIVFPARKLKSSDFFPIILRWTVGVKFSYLSKIKDD
jgi:hypothetical protein